MGGSKVIHEYLHGRRGEPGSKDLSLWQSSTYYIYKRTGLISLFVLLCSLPPSPKLHLERDTLDVGTLVTDHQIHKTSFSLSNCGNRMGSFTIDVSPLPEWISLQPTDGQLEPGSIANIQVRWTVNVIQWNWDRRKCPDWGVLISMVKLLRCPYFRVKLYINMKCPVYWGVVIISLHICIGAHIYIWICYMQIEILCKEEREFSYKLRYTPNHTMYTSFIILTFMDRYLKCTCAL